MSVEPKEEPRRLTQNDYDYLIRRMDRIEQNLNSRIDSMYERIQDLSKKIRIVIGILIEKKMVGAELAKRIEETAKDERFEELLKLLDSEIKESR